MRQGGGYAKAGGKSDYLKRIDESQTNVQIESTRVGSASETQFASQKTGSQSRLTQKRRIGGASVLSQ
jgi:hypothetical protein